MKQADIWEDYKQIYLDFSLNNDDKVRDKVLFVSSFDGDFNARQEEIKMDPVGYFLIDAQCKPARALAQGIPLSYETGQKEIDLKDKQGVFQFLNAQRKEIQTKEMPVTILIPNPRSMYNHQISFASIAKTIMTLAFMGRKNKKLHHDEFNFHLNKLHFLQEFDVKVQKDQCLLQFNPEK